MPDENVVNLTDLARQIDSMQDEAHRTAAAAFLNGATANLRAVMAHIDLDNQAVEMREQARAAQLEYERQQAEKSAGAAE